MSVSVSLGMVNISISVVANFDWAAARFFWVEVVVVTFVIMVVCSVVLNILVDTVVMIAVEDICSVGETGVCASQDVSAGANHVCGEGKLLAVQDKDVFVVVEGLLASSALLLSSGDSSLLVTDLFVVR